MGWIYYYSGLIVLLLATAVYSLWHPGAIPSDLKFIGTMIGMLSALGQSLSRSNFRAYLYSQKIWLFLNKDKTILWRFSMRFDGNIDLNVLTELIAAVPEELSAWNPQLISREATKLRMIVDKTIHLTFALDLPSDSEDARSHLSLRSDQIEVTYGSARKKIDSCIVPLMSVLGRKIGPDSFSSSLEVELGVKNPFFAFFVAHLPQEQVTHFNLVFKPGSITRSNSDRVFVTQKTITINAETPESFALLSKAFLLLSEDAITMQSF